MNDGLPALGYIGRSFIYFIQIQRWLRPLSLYKALTAASLQPEKVRMQNEKGLPLRDRTYAKTIGNG